MNINWKKEIFEVTSKNKLLKIGPRLHYQERFWSSPSSFSKMHSHELTLQFELEIAFTLVRCRSHHNSRFSRVLRSQNVSVDSRCLIVR